MTNKYNLKWNSHHVETFQGFDALRHREVLVDVALSCDGQSVKAHKLILCAGSGYFERIFSREVHGNGTPTIHFYGVDMHLLKFLIEFMYCGEVDIPSADLEKFIALAENLEVKGLKGDRPKGTGSSGHGTAIPVQDIQDALAHKRKIENSDHIESTKTKLSRSQLPVSPGINNISAPVRSKVAMPMPLPLQGPSCKVESNSSASEEVQVKEESSEEVITIDSSAPSAEEPEHEWEEDLSETAYYSEEMEEEPEAPASIPSDVDPQSVCWIEKSVWCGVTALQSRLFFCGVCPYKSSRKDLVSRHGGTHTRPFQCTVCLKAYTRKEYLQDHLLKRHSQSQDS
ncbi:unnamed protein product [Darwinula stevensoni]|uniref:Uncharacterized protein n=1 Tax=Darwinula stevensoni TaxID=69355 RepID=A0A7R8XA48_9CRUS|nr:unnamed protein product [Darwinula stevensoni]CAG0883322.1 unnamed protein product [Darwinula stevensoni]